MFGKMKKQLDVYTPVEKAALVISGVTIFLLIVLTNYSDVNAMLRTHVFWDKLFDNPIMHYYDSYTDPNIHNFNLLSRLPLIIWYLPSWLITKLFGGEIYVRFYHQMWHKLFLIIMYVLCIKDMAQICKEIEEGKEGNKYAFLSMIVSPSIILSVFYSGQDEIVYIVFFMHALLHYIRGNRKKYYFWLICSIACCSLMLLPYLLLTVIDDKKIYSIIGKILVPLIPQWCYSMFFSQCLTYKYTTSDNFLEWYFTRNNISMGYGTFSILAVLLVFIFVFAYLYHPDSGEMKEKIKKFLFFCTVMFMTLEILGWDQFYRKFLWIPFAILFLVKRESLWDKICYLIVIAADIIQSIRTMYDINLISFKAGHITALTKKILGEIKYQKYPLFSSKTGTEVILLNSLMVSCLILFVYFGGKKWDSKIELTIEIQYFLLGCSLLMPYYWYIHFYADMQ